MKVENRTEVNKDVWASNNWQQTHEVPDSRQINILYVVKFVLVEMSAVCCLQCFSPQEPDLNINRERGSVQGPDPLLLWEEEEGGGCLAASPSLCPVQARPFVWSNPAARCVAHVHTLTPNFPPSCSLVARFCLQLNLFNVWFLCSSQRIKLDRWHPETHQGT